jgi:hypothetical protein
MSPFSLECQNSQECSKVKAHLDECTERVENGAHEDCKCYKNYGGYILLVLIVFSL